MGARTANSYRPLLVVLGIALLLRAILAGSVADLDTAIVDEQHYAALATNLADGNGFGWSATEPTSIRPPLYPAFVATIWAAAGTRSLQAVRWAQIPLALISILLVYHIGCRCFDRRTALVAAAGLAVYPSLLFSGVLLLTETLFTMLLLVVLACLVRLEERPSSRWAVAAGAALGLAALARSVMWPFIAVLVVLVWMTTHAAWRRRVSLAGGLVLGYLLIVAPWSARNSTQQGTFTVIDTMGGLNLMMGNYAHTPEDRMWDAVSLTGNRSWSAAMPPSAPDGTRWTEGKKEKWAQGQALEFMRDHPWVTLRRSALKLADFWGLERDFIAGVQRGYYNPPGWVTASGAVLITLAYTATAVLAVVGIFLAPPRRVTHLFLLAPVFFICAIHAIVFGHSRYHLPLVPVLLLYAASALTSVEWRQLVSRQRPAFLAAAAVVLLCITWGREVLTRDWERITQLLGVAL